MTTHAAPAPAGVRLDLDAYCWTCQHRHRLGCTPQDFTAELWEWEVKHRGHDFEFLSPQRRLPPHIDERSYALADQAPWWIEVRENANIKLAYAAAQTLTITLASLASNATWVQGQESTAIDNTSNLYVDYRLTAKVTTGTSPTLDTEIRLYGYYSMDDTPTYPDTITGANSARTITTAYILDNGFGFFGATPVQANSNFTYPIRCVSVAALFGFVPKRWGVYVAHNTNVALNASAATHALVATGAYLTSV